MENCVSCDIGQIFGVTLIAAFIALSESKKVTLEDSSDEAKEKCEHVGQDIWICCGKVYKNRVALAIHARKVHGKCSCHLSISVKVKTLQCNACAIKYPVKIKLHRHLATTHHGEIFVKAATKNFEARIEVKAPNEVIASHDVKKHNVEMPMVKNGKRCKKCGKILSRKSNLKPQNLNNTSRSVKMFCCNCDFKSGIGNKLQGHSLMKHGKLNLVTIVPDRGKLDAHKLQVSNGKIASIQVMVANCDKCSPTAVVWKPAWATHAD